MVIMDIMDIMNVILSYFPHINPNGLPGHGLDLRYLFDLIFLPNLLKKINRTTYYSINETKYKADLSTM